MSSSGPVSDNGLGALCKRDDKGLSLAQLDFRCLWVRLRDGVGVFGREKCEASRLEGTFSFLTRSRLEAKDSRERVDPAVLGLRVRQTVPQELVEALDFRSFNMLCGVDCCMKEGSGSNEELVIPYSCILNQEEIGKSIKRPTPYGVEMLG